MPATPRATPRGKTKKATSAIVASPAKAAASPAKTAAPTPAAPAAPAAAAAAGHAVSALPAPSIIPTAVWYWLVLSSLIVLWDASFVLNRPRSMKGGDLNWAFGPYNLYVTIDKMYGDMKSVFVVVQSWGNLVEVALNLVAAYVSAHAGASARKSLLAALIALVSLAFTFWKTAIYFAYGRADAAHNDWQTYTLLYALPNGMWLLAPLLSIFAVGGNVLRLAGKRD